MALTFKSYFAFFYACFACGISSACVKKGLKHFTPLVIIFYRMFFGLIPCLIDLIIRYFREKDFRIRFSEYIYPSGWGFFHICMTGILFLGFTYPGIAIALVWVPSHAEQIMHPIEAMFGAILAHFVFHDERFNIYKVLSLIIASIGVGATVYPSFDHTGPNYGMLTIAFGYFLIIFAVIMFAVASVYMKLRTSTFDTTIVTVWQMIVSSIFCLICSFLIEGPKTFIQQTLTASLYDWIWPIIIGVFGTGLAQIATLYLVNNAGAAIATFIGIGQVPFGILAGVVWLQEWKPYSIIERIISSIGIFIITIGVIIGFIQPKDIDYEQIP